MVRNAQCDSSQRPLDFLSIMCFRVGFEFEDDPTGLQNAPDVVLSSRESAQMPYQV